MLQETLESIYDTIKKRKEQPKEGSYTNYLQKEGIDKICKKIGEEAAEVIIATKNNQNKETVYELADLFFHILVLMHTQGISLNEIDDELQNRFK